MVKISKKLSAIKLNYRKKRYFPMTICIAAICIVDNKRNGIVFSADRLRSSYSHKLEGTSPKYKKIPGRAVLMGSGETQLLDEILNDDFLEGFSDKSTKDISFLIKLKIREIIQNRVEDEVLVKHGLTIGGYLEQSQILNQSLIDDIEDEKEKIMSELDLEFILAGVDKDSKPRLYTITKNGCYLHSTQNVAIIGSGTSFSNIELAEEYRNDGIWLCESLLKVYKAKRLAEHELHVGRKTDLGLICASNELIEGKSTEAIIEEFDEGVKELLEVELKKIKKKEGEGLINISDKLNIIFYEPAKIEPQPLSLIKDEFSTKTENSLSF